MARQQSAPSVDESPLMHRYTAAIEAAEKATFSVDHATQTHRLAQDAYDNALLEYEQANPRPADWLFACPDCGADVRKRCTTVENLNSFEVSAGSGQFMQLSSSAMHIGRKRRVEVANRVFDEMAAAHAKKAFDAVIVERSKDFMRHRIGLKPVKG